MSTPDSRTPWRLFPRVAVGVAAAALVLSACAEPAALVTGGGTVAPGTAVPSGAASASSSASLPAQPSTSTTSTTSTTKPATWPTAIINVNKSLTDTGLGHKVAVLRVIRGLPWPAGYVATSQAYELVAVQMTWIPSTTYTAPLRRADFSIRTGATFPSRPIALIDALLPPHQMVLLPSQVLTGKTASGWLVFKVDPKGTGNLTLVYTRPKAQVSGGSEVFNSQAFSVVMTGSPVATS